MARTRRRTRRSRRRRRMPWSGWGRQAPRGHARTVMLKKCGKKCFLGPRKSFPICTKGTCKVNSKGVYAAYIRAREWGKKRSSYKSKGKYVTQRRRGRRRRIYMKGSRPRHRRGVYASVARRATALLRKLGIKRGGKSESHTIDISVKGGRRRRRRSARKRRRRRRRRSASCRTHRRRHQRCGCGGRR